MIAERYEADIAFSFAHSLRRNMDHGLWKPVAYSFPPPGKRRANSMASVYQRLSVNGQIDVDLILTALQIPQIATPFRDLQGDACRILDRLNPDATPTALDVIEAGFFRDRSAFLVGRWVMPNGTFTPFVVGLLNSPAGVYVDAVLPHVSDIHDLFSLGVGQLPCNDSAVLPDVRFPVQHHAATAFGPSLLDHRLQPCG